MFRIWSDAAVYGKCYRVASVLWVMGILLIFFCYNWIEESISQAHIPPEEKRINIESWVYNAEITPENQKLLSRQIGICRESVEKLLEQGRRTWLLKLQEKYFAPVNICAQQTTPLTVSECLVDEKGAVTYGMPMVDLQDGDILITKNSRFLGWRNGHAGLVIDAEKGQVLEAIMLGVDTKISSVEKWSTYPSFQVLRLKEEYCRGVSAQEKTESPQSIPEQVATYAGEELTDIPYGLLAGVFERMVAKKSTPLQAFAGNGAEQIWDRKSIEACEEHKEVVPEQSLKSTHCSHLVWYAYKQFGIDLDSDGGLIVTPNDIQNSEYLEIIQSYGY